jgi:hypothetical protein
LRGVSRAWYFFGVRLGTCIALELAVAAGTVGGVWFGVGRITANAGSYLGTPEAIAATPTRELTPESLPRARLAVTPAKPVVNNIFGVADEDLLAPLAAAPVTRVKLNKGGTSLSLRVDFANGARASFKPEQIHPQSDPRREIAAYRMDRLLGLGHVAPTKEFTITLKELTDAADEQYHMWTVGRITDEATVRPGGVVHGELQWWIPEIRLAKLGIHRIDEEIGRDMWTAYLQVGARMPAELRPMLEQISTCILFDVLIDNADRWTGSNTEMSPDGKVLYFMDNTLSFSILKWGHETNVTAMRRIQVFSRGLVKRLRVLTYQTLVETLAPAKDSKLGPLLNDWEIHAVIARRDNMLRYIDQLIERFGEDAVLALP